jgi:hemerythrin superfamily protein
MAKGTPQGTGSTSSQEVNALEMLKADHILVKNLFEQYHSASADEKTRIAGQLFNELTAHAILEEELFYPAVESTLKPADAFESLSEERHDLSESNEDAAQDLEIEEINGAELQSDKEQDDEVMNQAYEDHQKVEELIEQMKMLDPRGSDHQELLTELETIVIEHIIDEEDVMFPVAASQLDVKKLGVAMQLRQHHSGRLPRGPDLGASL